MARNDHRRAHRSGRSSGFDSTRHARPRSRRMAQCETAASPPSARTSTAHFPKISFRRHRKLRTRRRPLLALIYGSFTVNGKVSASGWSNLLDTTIRPGLRLGIDPAQAIVTSLTTAAFATGFAVVLAVLVIASTAASPQLGRAIDLLSLIHI